MTSYKEQRLLEVHSEELAAAHDVERLANAVQSLAPLLRAHYGSSYKPLLKHLAEMFHDLEEQLDKISVSYSESEINAL